MWMKLFLISLVAVMAHSLSLRGEEDFYPTKIDSNSDDIPNVIASLYYKKNSARFCSAFFVSKKYVLTAYVCVRGKKSSDIGVGIYRDTQIASSFKCDQIIEHPNAQNHINNFALILLGSEMKGKATIFQANSRPPTAVVKKFGHFFKFTSEGQDHFKGIIENHKKCTDMEMQYRFCVSTKIQLRKTDIGGPLGVFYNNRSTEYHVGVYTGYSNTSSKDYVSFESTYPIYAWIASIINGTKY